MSQSFYELLGIDPDADEEAIRRAYRERLKETHPDVSDDPDADVRTKRLLEAKETLLDSDERARYDQLGHDENVGANGDPSDQSETDAGAAGGAGTAASGGGTGGVTSGPDWSRTADADSGPTNARTGPWERRAREARARERVNAGGQETGGTSAGQAVADSTAGATATNGGPSVSWADSRVGVTVEPGDVDSRAPWLTVPESPATVLAAVVLYPVLVAGAVLPPFPLLVNLAVAFCTVAVIAALQSMPGVGVVVFAGWSVLGTVGLAVAGLSPLSLVGLLVIGATWFPLGLTLLTYWILQA